jgi:hypothetical protein
MNITTEPQYILTVLRPDGTKIDTSFGPESVIKWHCVKLNDCCVKIGARLRFGTRPAEKENLEHLNEKRGKSLFR